MNTLFVYGLLSPGRSLHHVVQPYVTRACKAVARGRRYEAEYPAVRFGEPGEVDGYVLWLDEARLGEALAILDDVEDEGEMYRRVTIDVTTEVGVVSAYAYHFLKD